MTEKGRLRSILYRAEIGRSGWIADLRRGPLWVASGLSLIGRKSAAVGGGHCARAGGPLAPDGEDSSG